jgi:hypothetical protein
LMVRFEDLIFHPKVVVQAVCECAGGKLKHEHDGKGFQYIVQSAKKTVGHGKERRRATWMPWFGTEPTSIDGEVVA